MFVCLTDAQDDQEFWVSPKHVVLVKRSNYRNAMSSTPHNKEGNELVTVIYVENIPNPIAVKQDDKLVVLLLKEAMNQRTKGKIRRKK